MKALTQPSDMIAGQLAFSGKNQRNGGFAAKFFGYISLAERNAPIRSARSEASKVRSPLLRRW
jgi:hypothetical protein